MSVTRILIVDDQAPIRHSVARTLESAGYESSAAANVEEARKALKVEKFDLVICDLRMPGESGLALVKELEAGPEPTPVLMITAVDNPETAHTAVLLGANGYLVKPFSVNELLINVGQALAEGRRRAESAETERDQEERIGEVRGAMMELEKRAKASDRQAAEVLQPLSEAVGRRDLQTGAHIRRVGEISAVLAEAKGMTAEQVEAIRLAAPMHDVGKVAIPDSVLLRPGKLDEDERALMERHAQIGHDILAGSSSPLLDLAAEIALTHQEKFDGSGYPRGLAGEEIPLSGRIVAIVDVFDAMTSDRPYRKAMPQDKVIEIMISKRGTHFDPVLLDLFLSHLDQIKGLAAEFADGSEGEPQPVKPVHAGRTGSGRRSADRNVVGASRSYGDALRAADGGAAERIALECLREGMSVESVYGDVIAPAMWRIGQLWEEGIITVADEHLATALTHRVMASVYGSTIGHSKPRPERILLAAIEGQQHSLGLRMVADVLELAGYQVAYLGGDVPSDALMLAIEQREPDLVGLSCTLKSSRVPIDAVVTEVSEAFPRMPILLGGQGISDGFGDEKLVKSSASIDGIGVVVDALLGRAELKRRGGAVVIQPSAKPGPISERHSPEGRLLEAAADAADLARAHAREAGAFKRLAYADPVTKGPNRRAFDDRLALLNDSPDAAPVAVMILDLDRFKQINDTSGHAVGDAVLREVAEAIEGVLREEDLVARLGGDEFGVLLPQIDILEAEEIAGRLLTAISLAGIEAFVTATIGIAELDGDPRHTMLQADRALYAAKRSGGNRVGLAAPS